MGIVWVPLTIKGVLCHWESRGVITEIELSPSPILAAMDFSITPPKFNSEFTPEKCCWKTILSYWVPVTFQGRAVKLREGNCKVYGS